MTLVFVLRYYATRTLFIFENVYCLPRRNFISCVAFHWNVLYLCYINVNTSLNTGLNDVDIFHFIHARGMFNMGYGMFGIWDFWNVGRSRHGMFGMWNVQDVGCLGCNMFGSQDVWDTDARDIGCLGCGVFVM